MIYTVTFNPALDYVIDKNIKFGQINKNVEPEILIGGKGINVSMVLKNLDIDSISMGFIAGFTGNEIKRRVESFGIKTEYVELDKGFSRINVKLKENQETAINANGPIIEKQKLEELICKISKIEDGDILVLAGSVPYNLKNTIYEKICENIKNKNIKIIVDATGSLLVNTLKYRPFLIKPNYEELEEIFNKKIKTRQNVIEYAKILQNQGAKNVLISLGGDGAILLSENGQVFPCKAPKGKVISTVGSGDSMIAGFIASYLKDRDYENALRFSVASGSASSFSKKLATKEEILAVLKDL